MKKEIKVIDAHAHFHNISIFDNAGYERAKEMYNKFSEELKKERIKIDGIGCIVFTQRYRNDLKEFSLNVWNGIYCDFSLEKIDEWEKYDFLKIHNPSLLKEKKIIEKIERVKRVQFHGDEGLIYYLDILSQIKAKIYIVHGAYLISRTSFEKRKELEDFLQEKEVYLGISPPNFILDEEEHKKIVNEVTECYSNTVFETDFGPYKMPYYFDFLKTLTFSISKLLEENKELAYNNALKFFTNTSSKTLYPHVPNTF